MDNYPKKNKFQRKTKFQWEVFHQRKMIHDATHKEIYHQQRLLVDDNDKKLLGCTSTAEDLRHLKSHCFIAEDERRGRWIHHEKHKHLLEPFQKVTRSTSGNFNEKTTPAENNQTSRHRLHERKCLWKDSEEISKKYSDQRRVQRRQQGTGSEHETHLERCLRVHSLSLNEIKR